MLSKKVPEIKEAYKLLEVVSLDKNSKELYEERQRALSERVSSLSAAKKEGKKEGKIEVARNLLDILDNKTIAMKTGLSEEEIESLRQSKD